MITLNRAHTHIHTHTHTHAHKKPHARTVERREIYLETLKIDKRHSPMLQAE
jgi:hypothetical protein